VQRLRLLRGESFVGRVSTASGSERGSVNKSFSKATLATVRGTDPEIVRTSRKIRVTGGASIRRLQGPPLTVPAARGHLNQVCAAIERRPLDVERFPAELAPDFIAPAALVDRQPPLIGAAVVSVLNDLGPVRRRA